MALGIMTRAPVAGPDTFGRETRYFARILEVCREKGVPAFVFQMPSPQIDALAGQVIGYVTSAEGTGGWSQEQKSFPIVVYDRFIAQSHGEAEQAGMLRQRLESGGSRFINSPRFISLLSNKWLTYRALAAHRSLAGALPKTTPYTAENLTKEVRASGTLYLKPKSGYQSRGVACIRKISNKLSVWTVRQGKEVEHKTFELGEALPYLSSFVSQDYLVQRAVEPALFLGQRFEVRVMMHKAVTGTWLRTGMVIRAAVSDLPFLLPGHERHFRPSSVMPKVFGSSTPAVLDSIRSLVRPVPRLLESHSGPAAELAVDVILDRQGKPWVLEVNSRPASLFTNVGAVRLRNLGIERIVEYAMAIAPSPQIIYTNSTAGP